jgi:hypothetical protein
MRLRCLLLMLRLLRLLRLRLVMHQLLWRLLLRLLRQPHQTNPLRMIR